jgi:hemerythrin-like domain-containing protein
VSNTRVKRSKPNIRVIQRVVAGMVVLANQLEAGDDVDPSLLQRIVDFLRTFADRCHHGKEEAWFFPALVRRGVPSHGCAIGGLTMEHQKGRQMVNEFDGAIQSWQRQEAASRENLVKTLRALATFYPSHIWKEDYLLFPLAVKFLTPEDQSELAEKFESVEHEIGDNVRARMERLADQLETYTTSGGRD